MVVGNPAEASLVRRSRCGDAPAFAELVCAYERVALAVAFSVTGDAGSAGDVAQEAFLRAWQRIGDLKEAQKFGPWLCGIVRNLAIDDARARAVRRSRAARDRTAERMAGAADPACDPLEECGRREQRQRVTDAIGRLDETSRCVVSLRYYENLSSKQIGELLGIAPTAVDMRLMRARRQLRQHLDDGGSSGREETGLGERKRERERESCGENSPGVPSDVAAAEGVL